MRKAVLFVVLAAVVMVIPTLSTSATFQQWREVPGEGTTLVTGAGTVFGGKLYLFGVGIGDHAHYVNVFDGARWTGWNAVPGGGTTSLSNAATAYQDKLYLFGIGAGDHAHYVNVFDGTQWAGWAAVPGGGTTSLSDAATVYRDKLYLFGIGAGDHAHYVNVFDGTQWTGWNAVPGGSTTSLSDAATAYQDKLYLFGIGAGDHAHYVNVFDGTQWAGWAAVPGGGTTSLQDAATVYEDKLYIFGVGNDHLYYVNVFDGTGWAVWSAVQGGGTTSMGSAAVVYDAKLYLFGVGTQDHRHYLNVGQGSTACRTPPLLYNEVQQRSIHNAYWRGHHEGVIDQLVYHRVRNIEWDIRSQPPANICGVEHAPNNDWFMYHSIGPTDLGRCDKLSDCLGLLRAFHNAVPEHEVVTVHLELKGGHDGGSCDVAFPDADANLRHDAVHQTPEGLDARLRAQLGGALFTPADLLAHCPRSTTLQEATRRCGWPTLNQMRGKIVVALLAANWNSATHAEDSLEYYAGGTGAVPNARAAFVAPLHLTDGGEPYDGVRARPWVVFHTEVFDPAHAREVRHDFPGSVIRSSDRDNPTAFSEGQSDFNFILTERVVWQRDQWARTHNAYGYPFCPLGIHGSECWTSAHALSEQKEPAHLLAIDVRSGDIWDNRDSFAFAFSNAPAASSGTQTWTAFVSNSSNNQVHHWAKGCVMARASTNASSPYYAVCRAGDDEELFIQYRSPGCNGPCGTARASASLGRGIQGEDATFVRLDLIPNGSGGVIAQGSGSADGSGWQGIGSPVDFPLDLPLQGLAASSNDPNKSNDDGTPTRFLFGNPTRNGQRMTFDLFPQSVRFAETTRVGDALDARYVDLSYFGSASECH